MSHVQVELVLERACSAFLPWFDGLRVQKRWHMPTWDPGVYLHFANQRTQPVIDLIARVQLTNPARVIDLGCGPGNSTAILRQRWPEADITGLDNSAEMLAAATQAHPAGKWVLADAASWQADQPFDLVFSNAALQWIPNHAPLFTHLMAQVAPQGALAVQMPAHYQSPLHQIALEVAKNQAWRHLMDKPQHALTYETPAFYYTLLQPFAAEIDMWETEYYHIVDDPQAIVTWYRGTGLRPFLEALKTDEQRQQFEKFILEGYTQAYSRQTNGRILFPFRRLFMVAYRK
jgi:trans-aconitate 2-methyltransferase